MATAAAFVLVALRTNRIFYDEQVYEGVGRNLSGLRLAQICNDGTAEYGALQCWRCEFTSNPAATRIYSAPATRVFGTSV